MCHTLPFHASQEDVGSLRNYYRAHMQLAKGVSVLLGWGGVWRVVGGLCRGGAGFFSLDWQVESSALFDFRTQSRGREQA